jgi:hypothetical protein
LREDGALMTDQPRSLRVVVFVAMIEGAGWFGVLYLAALVQGLLMP